MQDMLLKCQRPGAPDDCLDILDDKDVKLILEEASQGDLSTMDVKVDCGLLLMPIEGQAMNLRSAQVCHHFSCKRTCCSVGHEAALIPPVLGSAVD